MAEQRFKNRNWNLPANSDGAIATWDAVHIAMLMDLRDELQELNRTNRMMLSSIDSVRHFFHGHEVRMIMGEHYRINASKKRLRNRRARLARKIKLENK